MMSRVREALFSMLYPTGVLRDSASALDLFAGAGTVGIECLSRGVGTAVHVDFSPKCTETIRENLEALGLNERGRAVQASVFDVLLKPESFGLTEPFDLVTMTPPYEEVVYADLMDALVASPLLVEDTVLVIEVRAQPRPARGVARGSSHTPAHHAAQHPCACDAAVSCRAWCAAACLRRRPLRWHPQPEVRAHRARHLRAQPERQARPHAPLRGVRKPHAVKILKFV